MEQTLKDVVDALTDAQAHAFQVLFARGLDAPQAPRVPSALTPHQRQPLPKCTQGMDG